MPGAIVKITLSKAATKRAGDEAALEGTRRAAEAAVLAAQANITAKGRVSRGRLRKSIRAQQIQGSPKVVFAVGSTSPYALYQEKGTRGSQAKPGKFLRFRIKRRGPYIFAKKVRGVRPAHFMRDALRAVKPKDYLP